MLKAGQTSITNTEHLAVAAKTIGPLHQEYEANFRSDANSLTGR
jgi:hypothetical protein